MASFLSLSFTTEFEKIAHLFIIFFKEEPTWAKVAETDLAYISPWVSKITALLGNPSAEVIAMGILSSVQMDIVLATKFIQAIDTFSNKGYLADVLNSIINNLQGLLSLESVKTHPAFDNIFKTVDSMILEIKKILETMPKA